MARITKKLGEILRGWGAVNETQLDEALKVGKNNRKRIGETLVELGYADDNDVAKALASQHNMEFVDLDQPNVVKKDNLGLIPIELINKYQVLPLGEENGRLKVLVHDPMDLALVDDLRFRVGRDVDLALGARSKIKEYIDNVLDSTKHTLDKATQDLSMDLSMDVSMDASMDSSIDRGASIEVAGRGKDDDVKAEDAPVIRLVTEVIKEAVTGRASDIHIEPFEDRVRLRYRIDGVCIEKDKIPKSVQFAVTARLKILAGVRVEEKRIPQDGRIKMRIGGSIVDFRVSFCPVYHGESIVLRILRPDAAKLGLEQLGMEPDTKEEFLQIIDRPNGIFLVTGPTGSGKTTTLYTALDLLNRPDRKIITAEDPIEYNFKGINQCQVNMDIDPPLSFSRILRAMLRQAPNVILVGEIRDKEVGEVAIQAALTGHLVFSTLHTNDAPSAITRLVDMGLKPFLVASSIQAVLAQRLVRKLAEDCWVPDENPDPLLMAQCGFKPEDLEGRTIYKPGSSPRNPTGFRGRRGIYELMVMNSELRELAFKRAALSEIKKAALATGMRNLLGDGRLKILRGITSMSEIAKITQVEGVVDVESLGAQAGAAA